MAYWIKKIERNIERDKTVKIDLENLGWTVIRFWSNLVINHTDYCLERVLLEIKSKSQKMQNE